jgi:diguanylate cyclase (GGDEF)-like protein/PAS domain S-box-containing protein
VDIATNGEEGLKMVETASYDLVLVDYNMPFLGGIDVVHALSLKGMPVPVIMVTGEGNEAVAVEAIKLGASDYIVKDVEMRYLEFLPAVIDKALYKQLLIKERNQMQQAVRESEERYRLLVELSPDGISLHVEGKFVFINPAGARLLGASHPDQIIGMSTLDVVHPDFRETVKSRIQQLGEKVDMAPWIEEKYVRLDGAVIDVEVAGVSFVYEGKPAVQKIFKDITERKQAEKLLKESEERYSLTSQGANDGLWDWNLKTNEIYFSERWKSMLGYQKDEIRGDPNEWFNRVHSDDITRVKKEIREHQRGRTEHLESEYSMLHKDGTYRWMLCRGLAVREKGGDFYRMSGSLTDITVRKKAEEQLLHEAFHDVLTGLPNRTLFMDRVTHAIAIAKRLEDSFFAVLFVDLDRFKVINDSLGHTVGDELLISLGRRLEECLRPGDTIARLGGDEFAILLENTGNTENAAIISERIQNKLATPFNIAGQEIFTTASIGIALSSPGYDNQDSPEKLLRDADTAMYQAKALGRANYVIFESGMHIRAVEHLQLDSDLRRAVDRKEFIVFYQPILSVSTKCIIGYEALVRWKHPERGILYPADFIQMAEETGIIISIDRIVLREACQQMHTWQMQFPESSLMFISVNLSNKHILQPDLVEYISRVLNETGLNITTPVS